MRTGTLALILLTAACSAPAGVAGVSTVPGSPRPDDGQTFAAPVTPPEADDPVRLPPPKLSKFKYAFPVKDCRVTYARKRLVIPKSTIWAPQGCAFVAPVDGVIREVNVQNRWVPSTDRGADREGRFVTLLGKDGVLYLGGHLDSIADGIRPGVKVKAGRTLGRVGNTGNARDTASNLYFAISWPVDSRYWWIRRGMVDPWDYLDAWFNGNRTYSPRPETMALRKKVGKLPPCSVQCSGKEQPPAKPNKPPKQTEDEPPVVIPFAIETVGPGQ
ncbi:M23 family metallopeptidase [Acrocarpospora catenulata]|uniref:M23 family metallopeptidase n=1 Tax=Acrocarpospora catenulata TaxID=2836182 RepID=UPI001BD920FF|nr:M23 family metallopeptidase [Acrocarpospora catenulata]